MFFCRRPAVENRLEIGRHTAHFSRHMDIESRFARLEERLTWLQKHTVEQDRVISAQSFEIEALKTKLAAMKDHMRGGDPAETNPPGERPPHY